MEIICLVLALYGAVGTTTSLITVVSDAVKHCSRRSIEDLFLQCFMRATNRSNVRKTYRNVKIDKTLVSEAIELLKQIPKPINDPKKVLWNICPKFGASITIEKTGKNLEESQEDVYRILKDAISEFYTQLPLKEPSFRQYVTDSLLRATARHKIQEESLESIQEKLEKLEKSQLKIQEKLGYLKPTVMVKESGRAEFRNPFRITKAEEFDHDYPLLAALFRKPANYDVIRGRDNLLLAGGRGCGKSMILRSLTVGAALEIQTRNTGKKLTKFKDAGLDYFGVYIKLAKGYFDDCTPDAAINADTAVQLFQHVFNMQLLKTVLNSFLEHRGRGTITISSASEHAIVEEIGALFGYDDLQVNTFGELNRVVIREEAAVRNYLGGVRMGITCEYTGVYTYVSDFPRDFCRIVLKEISDLDGARIYFLLDEFENLAEFQQTVVNTITKLRPDSLTLKLATRSLGVKSRVDLQGEPIQSPRDYQVVTMDYDIRSKEYKELLYEICETRLEAEDYKIKDIKKLLPEAEPYCELGKEIVLGIAIDILKRKHKVEPDKLQEEQIKECMHKMSVAIIHRNREGYKFPKIYSGFKEFTACSSGIISNFLELCKMAFYLAESSGQNVRDGSPIEIETQNEAIYIVSEANLDWIPRNIPNTGPTLANLVYDLADVFRAKLLRHMSEPEAARVVMKDPEKLDDPECKELVRILNDGMKWSVFQNMGMSNAYFPKHRSDVRSNDFTLNRILAPKLKISPRPRMRTEFSADDLCQLCNQHTRHDKRKMLVERFYENHPLFGDEGNDAN